MGAIAIERENEESVQNEMIGGAEPAGLMLRGGDAKRWRPHEGALHEDETA